MLNYLFSVLTFMLTATSLYCVVGVAGLLFGATVGLSGLLIVETMGVKRLPSVLGLNAVFQGLVLLGVGPLIGRLYFIFSQKKNYKNEFERFKFTDLDFF